MKNATFIEYATLYFGEEVKEVTNFFKYDIHQDTYFRNEKEFINKIINILNEYCNIFRNDTYNLVTFETEAYWICRQKEIPEKVRYVYEKFDKTKLPKLLRIMQIIQATKDANKFKGNVKELSSHLKKVSLQYK